MMIHHLFRSSSFSLFSRFCYEAPPEETHPTEGRKMEKGKEVSGADKLEQQLKDVVAAKEGAEAALKKVEEKDVVAVLETTTDENILRHFAVGGENQDSWHSSETHYAIARNPSAPVDVLSTLAGDKDPEVRGCVVQNEHTPNGLLLQLAKDTDINTLDAFYPLFYDPAGNPIAGIAKKYPGVFEAWEKNPIEQGLKKRKEYDERIDGEVMVARDEKTPVKVLEKMARSKDVMVRLVVAKSPKISEFSPEVLKSLLKDESESVVSAAIRNPELPVNLLWTLLKDKSSEIRREIARSERIHLDFRDVLRELAKDVSPEVRGEVANNERTPSDVLETLTHDHDRSIAEDARYMLKKKY